MKIKGVIEDLKKKEKIKKFKKIIMVKIYLGTSLELLWAVWGQFSFRQFLVPAYTSQDLQAPSNVVDVNYRDFNLFHLSLPKKFPLFIWLLVCRSLQCLISALTQGGGGGHFFRLTCSVVLWGGRNTANNTGVCSQCLSHTAFAPTHGACAFPVYPAQALGRSARNCLRPALDCMHFPGLSLSGSGTQVLHKGTDSVGPAFCALPRSEQLR